MELSQFADLSSGRALVLLVTVASVLASLVVPRLIQTLRLWKFPVAGEGVGGTEKKRQAYLKSARGLYTDGYKKV